MLARLTPRMRAVEATLCSPLRYICSAARSCPVSTPEDVDLYDREHELQRVLPWCVRGSDLARTQPRHRRHGTPTGPPGVVVSRFSVRLTTAMPLLSRLENTPSRWRSDRPRRSSRHTTTVSPARAWFRSSSRAGRCSSLPEACPRRPDYTQLHSGRPAAGLCLAPEC